MIKLIQLRLGLIGDHITASKAPLLHELAGRLHNRPTRYQRLVPAVLGSSFEDTFATCQQQGFAGLNITYPYKQQVFAHVQVIDPLVQALGAVNTVVFTPDGPLGYNTDYTGFVASYFARYGLTPPGRVCVIGAGGVARAVVFALAKIGLRELRLMDVDGSRAEALAAAVSSSFTSIDVRVFNDVNTAVSGSAGVVNCTPIGMDGHPGSPVNGQALIGIKWAFDAVYTPVNTEFLQDARMLGAMTLSGFELFFHQGVKAFEIFSGIKLDHASFRDELESALAAAPQS